MIYVIDDEPDLIETISFMLDDYEHKCFTDSSKLLEELSDKENFLLITDFNLGKHTGQQLIELCKDKNIKSILMSGEILDDNIADITILKPFQMQVLLDAVEKLYKK